MGEMGQLKNPILAGVRNFAIWAMPPSIAMKIIDKYFSYRVTTLEV
jgi:hypothetical protein